MVTWLHLTTRNLGSVTSQGTEEEGTQPSTVARGLHLRLTLKSRPLSTPRSRGLGHFILHRLKYIYFFSAYVLTADFLKPETSRLVSPQSPQSLAPYLAWSRFSNSVIISNKQNTNRTSGFHRIVGYLESVAQEAGRIRPFSIPLSGNHCPQAAGFFNSGPGPTLVLTDSSSLSLPKGRPLYPIHHRSQYIPNKWFICIYKTKPWQQQKGHSRLTGSYSSLARKLMEN